MSDKDFTDDMDLDLNIGDDEELPQVDTRPKNLQQHHKQLKKLEREPVSRQTYTIPVSVVQKLREVVYKGKLAGEKISASKVVSDSLKMYIDKL